MHSISPEQSHFSSMPLYHFFSYLLLLSLLSSSFLFSSLLFSSSLFSSPISSSHLSSLLSSSLFSSPIFNNLHAPTLYCIVWISMDSCLNQWDVKPFRAGGAGASRLERSFVGGKHGAEKLLLKCSWSPDQQKVACGSADRCSIKSHHITSHHVYDITSHDITSYYMYDITSHDIITHHIISHHITSHI